MWSNFELVSIEDETLTSAFCTNGLFRISSEEKVCQFVIRVNGKICYEVCVSRSKSIPASRESSRTAG